MFNPAPKPEKKKKSKIKFNKKKVVKMFEEKGITICEVRLKEVMDHSGETPAHRLKRRHYTDGRINSFEEIVLACPRCHEIMEKDPKLTEEIFKRLRGK